MGLFPTPESVYEQVKHLDARIGLCMDIGHTQRCGLDPSDSLFRFADRIFEMQEGMSARYRWCIAVEFNADGDCGDLKWRLAPRRIRARSSPLCPLHRGCRKSWIRPPNKSGRTTVTVTPARL